MLALTVMWGAAIADRERQISFFHCDKRMFRSAFHVVVKPIPHEDELWVATFHKVTDSEIRRKMKKAVVLRPAIRQGQP